VILKRSSNFGGTGCAICFGSVGVLALGDETILSSVERCLAMFHAQNINPSDIMIPIVIKIFCLFIQSLSCYVQVVHTLLPQR
jgi:hypothetical protein